MAEFEDLHVGYTRNFGEALTKELTTTYSRQEAGGILRRAVRAF